MEIILVWMTGALICGQIFRLLSLPILVGFIFSGYIFSVFDLNDTNSILSIPAEIGVELLLFSIGLKIKPSYFLNLDIISVFFIHIGVLTLIFFLFLTYDVNILIFFMLCISLTLSSTVIASKVLDDRKELKTFHGRISIIILIFQDILALILLTSIEVDKFSSNFFLIFLFPFFIPILLYFLSNLRSNKELELIAAIIIALFFGAEFFKFTGLTGEIGALIMGICLSNYKHADKLSEKIWGLREILLLAFFISLGMELKIDSYVLKHALFLLSFLIFKTVILFFLLLAFKLRSYTAFLITISLSTYSEFSLIILSSWLDAGAINSEILTIVTCSVCLSFIIGSIINNYVHEIYVYFEKYLVVLERKTHHPDEEPHTCGEAQVMIFGMGRIGSSIFQNLQEKNIKVVGFDADTDLVKKYLKNGKRVAFADAEDPGFWSKLRFGKLKTIILSLPEFHSQIWSTRQARKYGFKGKIIVPTTTKGDPNILRNSGADEIYDAYDAAGIGVSEKLIK